MSIVVSPVSGGVVVGSVSGSVTVGRVVETKIVKAPVPAPVKVSKVKPGTKRR